MLQLYAGPRGVCNTGECIDLPPDEARDLIKQNYAEAVDPPAKTRAEPVETTEAEPAPEAAVHVPTRKKRRRRSPPQRLDGQD
jgi:hypothetical protein